VRVLKATDGLIQFFRHAVAVRGHATTRIGNHLEIFIENSNKTGLFPKLRLGLQHGGIQVTATDDGPAHPCARQRDGVHIIALQGVSFKGVLLPRRGDKQRPLLVAAIYTNAVCVQQVLWFVAAPAEMPDVLSGAVILNNEIFSVTVGYVNVAVRRNGRFRRNVFFRFCILPGFLRIIQREQHFSVAARFNHLVAGIVADKEHIRPVFIEQRKPMRTGIFRAPGGEQLAAAVVDQHIILRFVGNQQNTPLLVLHHLVTILHRVACRIGFAPYGINAVAFVVVAQNGFLR
jgi:hypothetical protein